MDSVSRPVAVALPLRSVSDLCIAFALFLVPPCSVLLVVARTRLHRCLEIHGLQESLAEDTASSKGAPFAKCCNPSARNCFSLFSGTVLIGSIPGKCLKLNE